jgi:hypothetical protein
MILKVPSGFYRNVIPPTIGNLGNVTYTISSGEPPRIELNFSKVDRKSQLGKIISDQISVSPDTTVIKYNKSNISVGLEPRPNGSVVEFNDATIDRLNINDFDQQKEFTSSRYNEDSTINSQLLVAYNEFQSRLLSVSERIETLLTTVNNDEIRLNMNISKLQAIDEALKILPDDVVLIEDKGKTSSQISKLKDDISNNRDIITQLNIDKSKFTDSIQRLSKVM